jgi:hypothetical protein
MMGNLISPFTAGNCLPGQSEYEGRLFRQVGLAAKPIFHGIAQLIERDVSTDFQATIAYG